MRPTLILGAGGFIGSALTAAMHAAGTPVQAVLRRESPLISALGVPCHYTDIADAAAMRPLLADAGALMILTADSTPATAGDAESETRCNILPIARLIDTLQSLPPRPLVFLSSGGTIYGNPETVPVNEDERPAPVSFHGAAKLAAEGLWAAYAQKHGASVTLLRPANVYGPGQAYDPAFGLVRKLIEHARRDEPVEIYGDGAARRDYLYIDDMVSACRLSLNAPAPGLRTFNVGSGRGHSILEVCAVVEQVSGRRMRLQELPARDCDVRDIVLDTGRIQAELGWRANVAFADGVRRIWEALA